MIAIKTSRPAARRDSAMMLSRVLFAFGVLLLVMPLSYAGDPQPGVIVSRMHAWTGPYADVFAGYGWGNARSTSPFDSNLGYYYNWTDHAYSSSTHGFFGGGALGFDWQSGPLVLGLEGEIGYLGLKGSATDPNYEPGTTPIADTVMRLKSDIYSAAYGRFGITEGHLLLYGKGGMAILRANASTIDPCANAPGCGTTTLTMTGSKIMAGWSVGGGIEWWLRSHWSANAEYSYFDFGKIDTAGPSSAAGEYYRQSIDVTAHTVKLGLQYHF
jgi:outer membrane immunogenic protein